MWPDVLIIGAGITGLSCAWRLRQLGLDPLILEASGRAGGVIHSERIDGYLVEYGPNTFLPNNCTFQLLDEIGLTSQLVEGNPRAPRFVCIGGVLKKAPFGVLSARGYLRAAAEPFVRSRLQQGETIHDFAVRRLGAQVEERLLSPLVTGIYAGNTRNLSMAATFPKLVEMERRYGSLTLGLLKSPRAKHVRRGRTSSFRDGMETLPRELAKNSNIIYNVDNVRITEDRRVLWTGGDAQPKTIVITAPAYRAAQLLENVAPDAASVLKTIQYAPMVIATSSVPVTALPAPLKGFGFLVPRTEKLHLLGTLFNSALFPARAPNGRHLVTSFLGGALEPDTLDWPEEQIWKVVRAELRSVLKLSQSPDTLRVIKRAMAIPQYTVGHEIAIGKLKNRVRSVPGLFLAGNYLDGVSIAACIEKGERTAREVAHFLSEQGGSRHEFDR